MLRHSKEAIAHYSALLLFLMALAPALMGTQSVKTGMYGEQIAICTAFGISYLPADNGSDTPPPYKPHQPHCPLCILTGKPDLAAIIPPNTDIDPRPIIANNYPDLLYELRYQRVTSVLPPTRGPPITS